MGVKKFISFCTLFSYHFSLSYFLYTFIFDFAFNFHSQIISPNAGLVIIQELVTKFFQIWIFHHYTIQHHRKYHQKIKVRQFIFNCSSVCFCHGQRSKILTSFFFLIYCSFDSYLIQIVWPSQQIGEIIFKTELLVIHKLTSFIY